MGNFVRSATFGLDWRNLTDIVNRAFRSTTMTDLNIKSELISQMIAQTESSLARLREQVSAQELLLAMLREMESSIPANGSQKPAEKSGESISELIVEVLRAKGAPLRGTD